MTNNNSKWNGVISISLTVLVIGSVWGMLEMTLGGFLHAIHLPQKGAIMGGLAVSFMSVFITITGKPFLVPILGIIAALFKPFNAVIYGVPLFSPFVINPAIAIIMEALAFTAVAVVLKNAIDKFLIARVGAGILAGALGIVFYASFASFFNLGMWAALDFAEKFQTTLATAIPMAITGAIMLAAGHYIGRISLSRLNIFATMNRKAYYSALTALVLVSWAIPVVFRIGG